MIAPSICLWLVCMKTVGFKLIFLADELWDSLPSGPQVTNGWLWHFFQYELCLGTLVYWWAGSTCPGRRWQQGKSVGEGQATIWCLLGKKAGDNTQVRALAEALAVGYQEKHIIARPWELLTHLALKITLAGIDTAQSSALEAPWPDLVISAGRRNEPVARWIQQQSGGRTRLVHIGRPWAPLPSWDLVITTPQYFLPVSPNILHNSLPLHRVSAQHLRGEGEQLLPLIAHLPRPRIAVLMGGDSGRFVMTEQKGRQLGEWAHRLAKRAQGSLLVTDSARTPPGAGDAMQAQLQGPHLCHRWGKDGGNPYQGLLALADAFVVTGESMSMLGEAAETGRPMYIFDMGDGSSPWWRLGHSYRYKPMSHRLAMRIAPQRMRRDVGRIQDALVNSGRAQWLTGEMLEDAASALQHAPSLGDVSREAPSLARQELQRSAAAVRQLLTAR
ncbi:MAG: mitochondrial fission protein ELM1 [Bacteroidia bacterium]|jgi:mitochondrial fission protein ELM1